MPALLRLTGPAVAALALLVGCDAAPLAASPARDTDVRVTAPRHATVDDTLDARAPIPRDIVIASADPASPALPPPVSALHETPGGSPVPDQPPAVPDRPPVDAAPATGARPGQPAPISAPPLDAERWWLATPDPQPGRLRVVARGEGATLVQARQAAVDAGRDSLTRLRGSAPGDTEFEKSQAFRRPDGSYEAFVLISCDR